MTRPGQKTEQKKPYEPPKLLVYGKLTEMTQTRGTKGRADGPPIRPPNRNTGR
jgi:hypothetical protein